FIIGAFAAIVAMFLRRSLAETSTAESMKHKEAGSLRGLWPHRRAVVIVAGLTAGGSLFFYTFTTYMQKYLVNTAHMDPRTVSLVMTFALIVYMAAQPPFGALSDRIGRRNAVLSFSVLAMLGAVPLMTFIGQVTSAGAAFVLVLIGLLIASFYTSISGI